MKVYTSDQYIADGNNVSIYFTQNHKWHTEQPHRHDFIEIIYIVEGTAVEYVDNRAYEVTAAPERSL